MNTLNAVIGGAVSAVGDGGISLAALAGENPERFGKVLRPKSTDHFVAKPPAVDGLSSPGFGEQVRSNYFDLHIFATSSCVHRSWWPSGLSHCVAYLSIWIDSLLYGTLLVVFTDNF